MTTTSVPEMLRPTPDWPDWLRTKKWDLWATGTFAVGTLEPTTTLIITQWLTLLRRTKVLLYGNLLPKPVYAVYAVEWGTLLGRIHVHLLIGGVGGHPALPVRAQQLWTVGHMLVERYNPLLDPPGNPHSGACAYITKHPTDVTIYGTLRTYRPRHPK